MDFMLSRKLGPPYVCFLKKSSSSSFFVSSTLGIIPGNMLFLLTAAIALGLAVYAPEGLEFCESDSFCAPEGRIPTPDGLDVPDGRMPTPDGL
jgi:hypothetical protein